MNGHLREYIPFICIESQTMHFVTFQRSKRAEDGEILSEGSEEEQHRKKKRKRSSSASGEDDEDGEKRKRKRKTKKR